MTMNNGPAKFDLKLIMGTVQLQKMVAVSGDTLQNQTRPYQTYFLGIYSLQN